MTDPSVETPDTSGLGGRAARGAAVTMFAQLGRMIIQLGALATLARLLTPSDYGLVAMVLSVAGIAEIFRDFGLSSAAVQAKTFSTHQRTNLFWINTGIGVILTCVIIVLAPGIAAVYHRDELVQLTRLISIIFLFNGMATQYRASLNRALRFRSLAAVDVASPAIGLVVAVAGALAGLSYWALALQQIGQSLTTLLLLVVASRWLPGRPRRGVPMGHLLRFGWNIVATQLLTYAGSNADSFTIGIRFGAVPLGLYNRGFQLVFNPVNQLRTPISNVALPVLARLQDEYARYYEFVYRGQVALGYTVVAGLGILVSGSTPITEIVLGGQWLAVAPVIGWLSVAAAFSTLTLVGYWVFVSRGIVGSLFRFTFISVGLKIACILVGSQWGIVGVAAGYAISTTVAGPLSLWWLSRSTPIPLRRLFVGVLRLSGLAAVGCVVGRTAIILAQQSPAFIQLGADVIATVAVYFLCALLFRSVRRDLQDLVGLVRLLKKDSSAQSQLGVS